MNKVKHAVKPVNNEPRYKRVAALMIMICMAVIPWITYMKVVKLDSTASEYFQNSDGLSVDFFLYYKAFVVIILGILIACFIIGENIFPDNIIKETPVRSKSNRIMVIAVGIFIIMTVLSAVFSRYHATVRTGSPSEYESVYVIVSYMLLFLGGMNYFCYENVSRLLKNIMMGLAMVIIVLTCVEAFYKPLLEIDWIRNMITPSAYMGVVSDLKVSAFSDMVSLTFYNPDYYGGFCILLFPFMWNCFLTENRRIWQIIYGMLSAGMMFCVLKSKATASFYVLIIEIILTVIIHIRNLKRMWKRFSVYVLVMVSVIVIANVVSGGKLLETGKNIAVNETIDEVNSSADKFQLDDIRLEDNRLRIIGLCKELCIEVDNGTLQFTDGQGNLLEVSNSDDVIYFDNEGYSMVTITMNSYNQLVIDLGYDDTIEFYVSDNTFYGVGQNGSKVTDVSRDNRCGRWLYPLFTGRGYAWANTLPMLGKTILIGHGAGTFAYYFKQNDYVGLLNTHGSTKFVIDKPHSVYLQTAMEEGCVALVAMLVIFTMVIWNYIVNYKCIESGYADNKKHNLASVAGAGFVAGVGFMIYGLVNDSMVTVNPMFWIILGICVSSVYGVKNN